MQPNIKRIFLILGRTADAEIKPEVKEWIRKQVPPFPQPALNLTFYGKEPLAYWSTIKDAIETIKGNIGFSIITSGRLMTEDKVDFLNDYEIDVTILWDGINTEKIHEYDAVKNNPCILDIKRLNFLAMLSKYAYPLDILDGIDPIFKVYKKMHGIMPVINIDTTIRSDHDEDFCSMNCSKISEQMKYIIEHRSGRIPYLRVINRLKRWFLLSKKHMDRLAFCKNGYSVWNIDANGNVYFCHDGKENMGTIFNPENVRIAVQSIDCTYRNHLTQCCVCPVQQLCRSGCPMINTKERNMYYCKIKKAYLTPVMDWLKKEEHTH